MLRTLKISGWKKTLTAVLALAWLAVGSVAMAASISQIEGTIKNEEKRLETIKRQIEYHQRQVVQTKKKENSVLNDLAQINQNITLLEQQIRLLSLKEQQTQLKIEETVAKIAETEEQIVRTKDALGDRIVAIYKYGDVANFNLLFSAANAHEAMTNSYLLSKIARQDQRIIGELAESARQLKSAKAELENQKSTLQQQRAELEARKKSLKSAERQRESMLDTLAERKEAHTRAMRELQEVEKELQGKIRELLAKKRQLAASRKTKVLTYGGGKLQWPVKGKVTSPFGMRVHPTFKTKTMHTGIDIDARQGDVVRAAASGEVLYAGWLRGYGQIIIIDHGSDLTTVYAHLSRIGVQEGQAVKTGQQIGNVGQTGVATGSHLHFEVRVNGEARDPMRYLGR
jgi:murein DD-endopeptidase MepM/ murein hydrolase activator NlpD